MNIEYKNLNQLGCIYPQDFLVFGIGFHHQRLILTFWDGGSVFLQQRASKLVTTPIIEANFIDFRLFARNAKKSELYGSAALRHNQPSVK